LDQYEDVTTRVIGELSQRVQDAADVGVKAENIMIDPRFGLPKNAQQNLRLLQEFYKLTEMGYAILSALSRKRFIGAVLDGAEPQARAVGSATAHLLSIQQGACMVRAHDVKATADAIGVWQAMQMA